MKLDPSDIVALEPLTMTLAYGVTEEQMKQYALPLRNVERFLLALRVELVEDKRVRLKQILSFVFMVLGHKSTLREWTLLCQLERIWE